MTSVPHTERASTADELVAGNRQLVTLSTGARVRIRRVCRVDILARGAELLALASSNGKPAARPTSPVDYTDPKTVRYVQDAALEAGMLEPRYFAGAADEAPTGYVSSEALGSLKDEIFAAIMGGSGYSEEAAQAARFPDTQGAGQGVSAGGEEDRQDSH